MSAADALPRQAIDRSPPLATFDEDLGRRNTVHCHYMLALGNAGLGDMEQAQRHLERVLALEASHHGAVVLAALS